MILSGGRGANKKASRLSHIWWVMQDFAAECVKQTSERNVFKTASKREMIFVSLHRQGWPHHDTHNIYRYSSLINHSTSISTCFQLLCIFIPLHSDSKWIKTHFDLLFGHITSTSRAERRPAGKKKNASCTSVEQTAFSLFHCPLNDSWWKRTNIYLQVAPNKKISTHRRKRVGNKL